MCMDRQLFALSQNHPLCSPVLVLPSICIHKTRFYFSLQLSFLRSWQAWTCWWYVVTLKAGKQDLKLEVRIKDCLDMERVWADRAWDSENIVFLEQASGSRSWDLTQVKMLWNSWSRRAHFGRAAAHWGYRSTQWPSGWRELMQLGNLEREQPLMGRLIW